MTNNRCRNIFFAVVVFVVWNQFCLSKLLPIDFAVKLKLKRLILAGFKFGILQWSDKVIIVKSVIWFYILVISLWIKNSRRRIFVSDILANSRCRSNFCCCCCCCCLKPTLLVQTFVDWFCRKIWRWKDLDKQQKK